MSLFKGCQVIKLDGEGNPSKTENEAYIKFEVVELTGTFQQGDDTQQLVLLKKLA